MKYTLFALSGVLLAVLGLILFIWRRRNPTPEEPETSVQLTPPAQLFKLQKADRFRGVSVESHCHASSQLAGQEFPFESAPRLPVSGCEAASCECRFIGLPDRRLQADRRTGQDRRRSMRMEDSERRGERPRRSKDLNSWTAYRHL
jgi:hypothetical protein